METHEGKKRLTAKGANLLYLVVMVLLITVGRYAQEWDFNKGILITEICVVALPTAAFILFGRANLRESLRLNILKPVDLLLVIGIFTFGYIVAAFVNLVGDTILSLFGQLIVPDIPVAHNSHEYVVLLGVIAVSAGICEELLFRGYIMKAYEGIGMWGSIVITAVLFSMMHLNIQNILATLYLGVMLGFVVSKTNSIFAGMLGHFINNGVSVTLGYLVMKSPFYRNMSPEVMKAGMNTQSLLLSTIGIGVLALFFGVFVGLCMYSLHIRSNGRKVVFSDMKLGSILRSARVSWPLYVTAVIFLFMMVLEFVYIRTGAPLKLF